MKKDIGVALFVFACVMRLFAESEETPWRQTFENSFAAVLESRSAPVAPAITARYRMLAENRFPASGDPRAAGEAAALLLLRYERDIRSGVCLQEAGARLEQAVTLMGKGGDPEKVLRRLGMVRKGSGTGSAPVSGFGGKPADGSRGEPRGREKGR